LARVAFSSKNLREVKCFEDVSAIAYKFTSIKTSRETGTWRTSMRSGRRHTCKDACVARERRRVGQFWYW